MFGSHILVLRNVEVPKSCTLRTRKAIIKRQSGPTFAVINIRIYSPGNAYKKEEPMVDVVLTLAEALGSRP